MKIKSRFVAAIVTFSLALMMPQTFNSCSPDDKPEIENPDNPDAPDGPETPDKPENPEPEPKPETYCYKLLTETRADWEGDWIIAYVDGNEIFALHSGDADRGMGYAKKINGYTPSDEIPVEAGDDYKAVIRKDGDAYVIKVNGIGYIGSSGDKKMIFSESEVAGDQNFRWTVSFYGGYVDLKPVNQDKTLQYNVSAACFRFYTSGQKPLKMFMRSVSTGESGGGNKPDPNPDPEPTPDPDPTPGPDPDPVEPGTAGGWFELPLVNDADKNGIDDKDKTMYYAFHYCAGGEKGPGGKVARNFSTCYSSEHHCPVWVAAPRHSMYLGSTKRTNDYKADPDIPSDIQNGRWSGYTRGHMLGSSDRTCSPATNRQVFYYSNIAPQLGGNFNTGGGSWNNLEDHIDRFLCADTLYSVVGCYFKDYTDSYGETDRAKKIAGNTSYPTMFYYVLLRTRKGNTGKAVTSCQASELQCVAFVMRHSMEKGHRPQAKDMMSVSDLEKITGFKYFVNVPNAPKDTFTASDWL